MKHHSSLTIAALGVTVALLNSIIGSLLVAQEVTNPSSAETELSNSTLKNRLIAECEHSGLPAMWAGIIYTDGRPLIVEAAGKRKWGSADLADADDIVHLGSCIQLNISAEVWKELLTPEQAGDPNESYAGGWIIFDKPAYGGQAFFHNGSNTTWYSYALALPGKHACILVATNAFNDTARKACDQIARFMYE